MIFGIPELATEIGAWALLITGILTAIGLLARFFITPLMRWFENRTFQRVVEELKPLFDGVEEVKKLMIYHLGANGSTQPVRDKLIILGEDVKNLKQALGTVRKDIEAIEVDVKDIR